MTKKRVKILLISLATLLICVALIVAGTYALFSDSAKVSNHLQAGTLDITLTRDKLTSRNMTASGDMVDEEDDEPVDFSGTNEENLFGLEEGEMIVPGSEFTADMTLKNNGNVAFGWWLEIVLDESHENGENLAQQLQVTVKVGDEVVAQNYLSETLQYGTSLNPNSTVSVNAAVSFSVTVAFLNDTSVNNGAQAQEVWFDMIVYAVQATA